MFDICVDSFYFGQRNSCSITINEMNGILERLMPFFVTHSRLSYILKWQRNFPRTKWNGWTQNKYLTLIVWTPHEFSEWIEWDAHSSTIHFHIERNKNVPDVHSVHLLKIIFAKMHNDARRTWINISFLRAIQLISRKLSHNIFFLFKSYIFISNWRMFARSG